MRILLDIDGVMVPAQTWKRPEFEKDGFPSFSIRATNSLQRIISETGAEILLTTSHKSSYKLDEWRRMFETRGFLNPKIKKLNKNTMHLNRREEVMKWVAKTNEDRFVIIDDDKSLNNLPPSLKSKLVQTSATVGLNDMLADYAIEILKSNK